MKAVNPSAIAIVGMSCRFPGHANTPDAFWSNILNKVDSIEPIPSDRWDSKILQQLETNPETEFARVGGFVHDFEEFDSTFFGISPREASDVDPQQRILLELAWHCMEDAAISVQRLQDQSTGVYVGIINHDHERLTLSDRGGISAHTGLGRSSSIAANRLSYCFDLRGPSLAIDTACSSSLTAVDAACSALRSGEIDAAFAGGINAILMPESYIEFSRASMLSKTGKCHAFDDKADGFVRAEGGGLILLKRLSDALMDGDRIYATIVASTLNQDGRTAGIMAPNLDSQKKMMESALRLAGLNASDIGYVESHGTGTQAGDLVEAAALGEVYGQSSAWRNCPVGSVKTNIGHTEASAGIAGLIKATLAVWHGHIPPNLNFSTPNSLIDFDSLRIEIPTVGRAWISEETTPRIAAVNSFGFGGANAHVLIQQEPQSAALSKRERSFPLLIPLSAPSKTAIDCLAGQVDNLVNSAESNIAELCHTTGRRTNMNHRDTVLINQGNDRAPKYIDSDVQGNQIPQNKPEVAIAFNGIGAGWHSTGRDLYSNEPVFRSTIDSCDEIFQHLFGISIIRSFFARRVGQQMSEVANAHVLHFAVQMGVSELLKSWGVHPNAVVGHSVGEIAAACTAGCVNLVDAARIVGERALILKQAHGGGMMLAAGITEDDACRMIQSVNGEAFIAAVNSGSSVTLSGTKSTLENLRCQLEEQGCFVRTLDLPIAFHTPLIQSYESVFESKAQSIDFAEPKTRWFSSITGSEVGTAVSTSFWWENFWRPVRFAEALKACTDQGINTFIEVGPHPYLAYSIDECLRGLNINGRCFHTLNQRIQDSVAIRSTAADLFKLGVNLNWGNINPPADICSFPVTQFDRKNYRRLIPAVSDNDHQIGYREYSLDVKQWNWLNRHRILGKIVFPASGYIDYILKAASNGMSDSNISLNNVQFLKMLELSDSADSNTLLGVNVTNGSKTGSFACQIVGDNGTDPQKTVFAEAEIDQAMNPRQQINIDKLKKRCGSTFPATEISQPLANLKLEGDYSTWSYAECWSINDRESIVELINQVRTNNYDYLLHPTLLDLCFRTSVRFLETNALYVPRKIGNIRFWKGNTNSVFCHTELKASTEDKVEIDLTITDDFGSTIALVSELTLKKVSIAETKSKTPLKLPSVLRPSGLFLQGLSPSANPFTIDTARSVSNLFDQESNLRDLVNCHESASHLLTKLALHHIGRTLKHLGFCSKNMATLSLNELEKICRIDHDQRQLFHGLLMLLEKHALIELDRNYSPSDEYVETPYVNFFSELPFEPDSVLGESIHRRELAGYFSEIQLINRCGAHLEEVLTGKTSGIDVLFPQGNAALLQTFYQRSPTCQPYLEILIESVVCLLNEWRLDRKCRILEIGGGTGSILARLAPIITEFPVDYTFTDISASFVRTARERFSTVESLKFRTFDIDSDIEIQEFSEDSFDIVLANDVLHLSRDIRSALERIRDLLVPDGILQFIELTNEPTWACLTFGMLRDWWQASRNPLAPDSPCRDSSLWRLELSEAGFSPIEIIGDPELPHTVFKTISSKRIGPVNSERVRNALSQTAIFCGSDACSDQLINELDREDNFVVHASSTCSNHIPDHTIPNHSIEDYVNLLNKLKNQSIHPQDIILFWSFFETHSDTAFENSSESVTARLISISNLISAFEQSDMSLPKITVVTADVYQQIDSIGINSCLNSALWSIGRTIRNEYPETACRLIDVDPNKADLTTELCPFIQNRNGVLEAVLGESGWNIPTYKDFVNDSRFRHKATELKVLEPGNLLSIKNEITQLPKLNETEVLIDTGASALNFRDVMLAFDLLPDSAVHDGHLGRHLGMECTGTIVKIGKRVKNLSVGQRVVAIAPGTMKSFVAVQADFVRVIPDDWRLEEAVGLPAAYITAVSCANCLPKDKTGMSVLIHSASGGVGLALVNVFTQLRAKIFATAGSNEKAEFLNMFGVEHVASSRSDSFADEAMLWTGGKGVDVIINTLGGDLANANAQVLKSGGIYIELGKHQSRQVTHDLIAKFNPSATVHIVDIDNYWKTLPKRLSKLFHSTMESIENGIYSVLPYTVFPIRNSSGAFRYMAEARHIGKVVLDYQHFEMESDNIPVISPEASYLVAGGTRGFGFATALWLIENGAKHIIVVGRNPDTSNELLQLMKKLKATEVNLTAVSADITDFEILKGKIHGISSEFTQIKGVFHCAMEIEDRLLKNLNAEICQTNTKTKILGAWNLHKATEGLDLDFFVLFSSVTALIGPSGQASYSAANAFLDTFARYLRQQGIPATSINWGAVSDYGYVADNQETLGDAIAKYGINSLTAESMLLPLDSILRSRQWPQVIVSGGEWTNRAVSAAELSDDRSSAVRSPRPTEKLDSQTNNSQPESIEQIVLACFSTVLEIPATSIDPDESIMNLGLDSILTVEMSHILKTEAGIDISATELLRPITIKDIVKKHFNLIS